ncbi:MAG TPA: inorganic phosphate transporter [Herpetosiphonaceae bacterium]|nr:inorganic phosphate transporter [Herpetosiphonaceae bacterium]
MQPAPKRVIELAHSWPAIAALLAVAILVGVGRLWPGLVMPLGLAAMLGLAYANGANDVSKGIATLVGAGVTDYRRALLWGTLWTGVGAAASAFAARELVATFSSGLLAGGARFGPQAAVAVLLGTIGWLLLATRTGLPVSTTHSITGAIVGVGTISAGVSGVAWEKVAQKVALPLALGPVLAVGLGLAAYVLLRLSPGQVPYGALHWLSSGGTSMARALNDTPKIVALGAAFAVAPGSERVPPWVFLATAAAMVAGSWAGGRRVTRTLAERVTQLDDREGLGANLATALLVGFASTQGLPVSTTHVASTAIIGVRARRGRRAVHWRTVGEVALAWLVTLPVAALIGIAAYLLVTWQVPG